MLFSRISKRLGIQISRNIHIHKDVISGSNGQIVIAHGMLGSSGNWSSLSRRIAKETGKSVITFDARNHGLSDHTETMSYPEMAEDLKSLITEHKAVLVGHSMGGRTAMYFALKYPELVDKLAIVDVSPVNIDFDATSSTEWNMSHFFYAMKAVEFPQNSTIFQARKAGDAQLAKRIQDPGLRAWLLMNVYQDAEGVIKWRVNLDTILTAFKVMLLVLTFNYFSKIQFLIADPHQNFSKR